MTSGLQVVIITFNSMAHVEACLRSIPKGVQVTVVDNGSTDGTREYIRSRFSSVNLICNNGNPGYANAVNTGLSASDAEIVAVANADVVFPKGSLHALAQFLLRNPACGVVGPQLLFPDGSWQRSYGDVPRVREAIKLAVGVVSVHSVMRRLLWPHKVDRSPKSVGYVDGAVMVIRRAAFDAVGGFDEDFQFYGEEAEFCIRVREAGWKVTSFPGVHVMHVRGGSSTYVEGFSDRFLRAQTSAKLLIVKKHYPKWHVWIYLQLSRLHCRKMIVLYSLLNLVGRNQLRLRAAAMASTFKRELKYWG